MKLHLKYVGRKGYLVINDETGKHTHIKGRKTALGFIRNLIKGILPDSDYLIESARKILKKYEFDRLKPRNNHQCYVNVNKGVRR